MRKEEDKYDDNNPFEGYYFWGPYQQAKSGEAEFPSTNCPLSSEGKLAISEIF